MFKGEVLRVQSDRNVLDTVIYCATSGVSFKTLERAFISVLGVTPRRYLSIKRLSHARRLLLAKHPKMTRIREVAVACGYGHFARFSADYREQCGETPSQTASRSGR